MTIFKTPRFLAWLYPRRTWGFSLTENTVYLTFDDGPTSNLTPWILDFLEKEKIPATFFCVGENMNKFPEEFQKIKDLGHQVANHTMRHEKGNKTAWKDYSSSIDECAKLVGNNLFRPPYGRISALQSRRLSKKYKIIMWSWLSYDYDKNVSVESILNSAKEHIKAGDILVLHDNEKVEDRLKEILPQLVSIIKEKRLKFELIT
jgi:peptidoglycan-N-acetylglucosamine deacetylase